MNSYEKYLKYKSKYIQLKKLQSGGMKIAEINRALDRYRAALTASTDAAATVQARAVAQAIKDEIERNQGIVELYNLLNKFNELNLQLYNILNTGVVPVVVVPFIQQFPAGVETSQSKAEIDEIIARLVAAETSLLPADTYPESINRLRQQIKNEKKELTKKISRISDAQQPQNVAASAEITTLRARIDQLTLDLEREIESFKSNQGTNQSIIAEINRNDLVMSIFRLRPQVSNLEKTINDLQIVHRRQQDVIHQIQQNKDSLRDSYRR